MGLPPKQKTNHDRAAFAKQSLSQTFSKKPSPYPLKKTRAQKSSPTSSPNKKPSVKTVLPLSEKELLKHVLSFSPFIKKAQLEEQKNLSALREKKSSFSTQRLFSNWSQSEKNNPPISAFQSQQDRDKKWIFGLEKNIPYGLSLKSSYSHLNQAQSLSDFLKSVKSPAQIYKKNLSFELSAGLTSALGQYWALKAIDKSAQANKWLYFEKAEALALKSAGQYWRAYLAWLKARQAEKSLKLYQSLVQQIKSKKKYGFLRPGEGPQILAEYENLKQKADQEEQNYENEKKALLLFLQKDPESHEIQFHTEDIPPPLPSSKIKIENLRVLKIKKRQNLVKSLELKNLKAGLFPDIRFLGRGGWIPGGVSDNLSFSQKNSFYELGVSLNWVFFSKSAYEKAKQKEYELEESQIDFELARQRLKNKISSLEKEWLISQKNIRRAKKAAQYQKQAFKELKRSFEQGRADVFDLIQTESKWRELELKKSGALGTCSLLRLQMLALRDQLLEAYLNKVP